MRHAEEVTFGGSGLDRAAQLRGDAAAIDDIWNASTTRVMLLWRGKPLFADGALAWLGCTHPVLDGRKKGAVFLGLEGEAARFAVDFSDWQPEELPDTLNTFLDPSEQRHPDLPENHVFAELRRLMTLLSAREAELAATAKAILSWHRSHAFCSRCGHKSEISNGGWQSTCPSCGGHHFPRTDPVVIMLITHGNSVLMGRSPGWPEGMYSLLAGFVEPGEPMEAAVRREVLEETGVPVGRVSYLASQPWPFPSSLMLGCWGEALGTEITIDPVEIEDALWVTREEMLAVFAGEHSKIAPPRDGAIARFLVANWLADRLD
ncbi:NAD(+) diphosphatase [Actibacterium lipolyticum]|uniref:NAD(+) diphosphatase n=1 Tax=Actibacterium lipolyticum TaxID=1524263 RepID=A0A238KR88_9RHOB|nr:NAD(+) diphosphatase [Actibacterium lipolyticum]SMX45121.1 NADH pyrophosphatase [Actibacterium lipolyticum]